MFKEKKSPFALLMLPFVLILSITRFIELTKVLPTLMRVCRVLPVILKLSESSMQKYRTSYFWYKCPIAMCKQLNGNTCGSTSERPNGLGFPGLLDQLYHLELN